MPNPDLSIEHLHSPQFHARLEHFFFRAMLEGYVANPQKGKIAKLPGSQSVECTDGLLRLLDVWTTNGGSDSHGTTHIWYCKEPVWVMQYMGAYSDQSIPTLTEALKYAYQSKAWCGGRGPLLFRSSKRPDMTYVNTVGENDFAKRSFGEERVFWGSELIGWHRYQSMLLV